MDAALDLASEAGPQGATVVAIARRLGAPSGSIYHRFASRDLILARLWIRTVTRFQAGFLRAMSLEDPLAAAEAAVAHTLSWAAEHPREGKVLVMYRREDLIALWPDALGDELSCLNDAVTESVTAFTRAHFGVVTPETAGLSRFALIDLPYAAARRIINESTPLVPWLSAAVTAAAHAVLTDQSPTTVIMPSIPRSG